MALDYDGTPNGLFVQLGKVAKHYAAQAVDASDLSTDLDEINGVFEAMTSGEPETMVDGFATSVVGWQAEHFDRRTTLQGLGLKRLQDRTTVLDEIGATSTDQAEILSKLIKQMTNDTESVDRSTVSIGSVTAGGANVGNGTAITTTTLDGATSPGSGVAGAYAAHRLYAGLTTELCVPSETMRLTCVADSFSDGTASGNEQFSWEGRLATNAVEGSGLIGTITPVNGETNLAANGNFEDWTDNLPDTFTLVAGVAGTHIVEESTGANVFNGLKSVKYVGDGTVNPELSLSVNTLVTASKRYAVTCRIMADATVAAGDLTIQFEGTGYTAGGSEKITVAHGSLPTSWTLKNFFVNMPATIPSDFRLVLRWGATPTATKRLWIDDLAIAPVNYGGGLGAIIVRGATPFVRGDVFTFTVANDDAGAFQKFFRQAFGVQLPSAAGGAETIDDALTA